MRTFVPERISVPLNFHNRDTQAHNRHNRKYSKYDPFAAKKAGENRTSRPDRLDDGNTPANKTDHAALQQS